jgi:hypothetical protein
MLPGTGFGDYDGMPVLAVVHPVLINIPDAMASRMMTYYAEKANKPKKPKSSVLRSSIHYGEWYLLISEH